MPTGITALFDSSHGQPNWSQTGFSSREVDTNFSGIASILKARGAACRTSEGTDLDSELTGNSLLVVPPPTGIYHPQREAWRRTPGTLFRPEDVCSILRFVRGGGRLLAFGYRFGDSFTQSNVGNLFAALGCILNDDAVVNLQSLKETNALLAGFQTERENLRMDWAMPGVTSVRWRSVATFTILPGANVSPLVMSPGGRCITFNRTQRRISFQSLPIAVAGAFGSGRFVLIGGPHAFETGRFGLLREGDNARFIENILSWLLAKGPAELATDKGTDADSQALASDAWRSACQIDSRGSGRVTVAFVEKLLRRTGTLKAISRTAWAA